MTMTSKCLGSGMRAQLEEGRDLRPGEPPEGDEDTRSTGNEAPNLGTGIVTVNRLRPRGARLAFASAVRAGAPVGEPERAPARAVAVGQKQGDGAIGEPAVGATGVGHDLLVCGEHVQPVLQLVDR